MKWIIVFEADDELDLKEGDPIYKIDTEIEGIDIKGILKKFPLKRPVPEYDFENYSTGFAKGYNYAIDDINGKDHGIYDPETDDLHTH